MSKYLDSPLACLLITGVLFLGFIYGRLYQSKYDPSSFVVAGSHFSDPARAPQTLTVINDSVGFDGQFYYRLALNPFTSQPTENGITLDVPSLRHQRILYPCLAWALSLGNPDLLPATLIILNFFALCLMGLLGGIYAQTLKLHALWGIFLPLYPGFLLTLSRDTVEILEATFVLGSLLLLRRRKPVLATLLLTLAVLTKETAVLVAVAGLPLYLVGIWKKNWRVSIPWYYIVLPLVVYALWQLVLFHVWGVFPLWASGNSNLGIPFVGPASAIMDASVFQRPFQFRKFIELTFLVAFAVAVVSHLRYTKATRHEVCSWVLLALLVVSLGSNVWIEDWTFMRVLSLFYVLGAMILIATEGKFRHVVLGSSLLFWGLLFFKLMRSYAM